MLCPSCMKDMESGFLYVRGFGGALFWSEAGNISFFSRRGLDQIDLTNLSVTGTGAQAVLAAARCPACTMIAFETGRSSGDAA